MKKITLLIISISFSAFCFAQNVTLNDGINVSLPDEASKLNKEQTTSFAIDNGFDIPLTPIKPRKAENIYSINHMLLELYDFKGDFKENDLDHVGIVIEKRQENHEAVASNNTSAIKVFNNYKARIRKFANTDRVTFLFSAINNSKTYMLNGIFQCGADDAKNGETILNEIISSINFKE